MRKRRLRNRKHKFLAGIFLLVSVYFFFLSEANLFKLWKLHRTRNELQKQLQTSEIERENYLVEIDRLKNDSTHIEKIAREKYKMGKPGEKVYVIKEKKSSE